MSSATLTALILGGGEAVFTVAVAIAYSRSERHGVPLPAWLRPVDRAWGLIRFTVAAPFDRLLAPLYRREARRRIVRIEGDIAMIAPLGRPDLVRSLREVQAGWARRLRELG